MSNKKNISVFIVLVCSVCLWTKPASAGVFTDDLSKCLVAKSTSDDKTTLMAWMFAAISLNPKVTSMVNMTKEQRAKINSDAGKLFEKLLTETCKPEVQAAVKNEGTGAIESGFRVLGEVAGRELFSDPLVAEGMRDLDKYVDMKKIKSVLEAN
jgi:hypothetical protein